jgi:hypothetical protein
MNNEYATASGTAQDFSNGVLLWNSSSGVVSGMPLSSVGNPAAILLANNVLELFGLGTPASTPVMENKETSSNSTNWTGFSNIGGSYNYQVTALVTHNGSQEAFVIGNDHAVWNRWWTGTGWSGTDWNRLGGSVSKIVVLLLTNGCEQILGINCNSPYDVLTCTQTAPNGSWGPWTSIGGSYNYDLTAIVTHNGCQEAFVVGNDHALWHRWWTGNGWSNSDWTREGGCSITKITAILNTNGCEEIFAIGTDGGVYAYPQTAPNSGWGPWINLSGGNCKAIAAIVSANGCPEVLGIGGGNFIYSKQWTSSGWPSSWTTLPGGPYYSIAVGKNQNGCEQVFGKGSDGAMWTVKQTTSSTWSNSQSWSMGGSFY